MKVKTLIKQLKKLDQNKNIFVQSTVLCTWLTIKKLNLKTIHPPINHWTNESNIWDYIILESNKWLEEKWLI